MVEWNAGSVLTLISAIAIIIGSLLGWWAAQVGYGFISLSLNLNPLYGGSILGFTFMRAGMIALIAGLMALAGGCLVLGTFKKRAMGLVGSILAISALALFIVSLLVEGVQLIDPMSGTPYGWFDVPIFGSFSDPYFGSMNAMLGAGFYIIIVGAILGFIAFAKTEDYETYNYA